MKTNSKYMELLGGLKTKKISVNVEEKTLEILDDLAKLTEVNRTIILSTILGQGTPKFMQFLHDEWQKMERVGKGDAKKIKELQKKLITIRAKW